METQEKDIIKGALSMFNKYGLRSVTMDDVARELGISKKTIYKYFENKADLVARSLRTVSEQFQNAFKEVADRNYNAIDELFEIHKVVRRILENSNPGLKFQLQKYYPEIYNRMYEGRRNMITKIIARNVKKGQEAGLYREEVSSDIVSYLYCTKIEALPDEEELIKDKDTLFTMMRHSLDYHIRGMATSKGIEYLEQRLKSENQE